MGTREIMAGNLVCGMTGVPKELAEQAMKATPDKFEDMLTIVDKALEGPFGTVAVQCDCAAWEGVEETLTALEQLLTATTNLGDLTKEAEDAVREDRQFILRQMQAAFCDCEKDPVEELTEMLKKLGFKAVRV